MYHLFSDLSICCFDSPTKHIQETDKGIFAMLYLADNIEATVSMDDVEKEIQGPLGYQSTFPVSQIILVLSSVASMCPDKSIRFYTYKLIEKFLYFCTDETRFFFLTELIERCPFPSMNTAIRLYHPITCTMLFSAYFCRRSVGSSTLARMSC